MSTPPFRLGRVLLGFMPEQEALNFLNGMCVVENQQEVEDFKEQWRRASHSVKRIGPRALPTVKQRELPSAHSAYVQQVSSQPIFKHMFGGDNSIREVEIGPLIAFQRHIDTQYASELASRMGDEKFLLESCLPVQFQQNVDITYDPAVPGVTFSSFSPKLIVQGVHISGVPGPPITIGGQPAQPGVLIQTGSQPNYVQVVEYRTRYFLRNGYHRTYAALLSGHKYVPAVVTTAESLAEVGAQQPGFFPKDVLISDTPPLIEDFLKDDLAAGVKLRQMRKVIRVRVDDFLVPR